MDKNTYLQLEYQTLRKEIEDSLSRAFQIMVGGASLIPVLVGIVAYYASTAILLTLPMMVVVIALLYLNQWNSIMRCGRYIRTRIEEPIMGGEGWEAWLESLPDEKFGGFDNRLVDSYLVYAFYLLTAAYYFATSYIAILFARGAYGPIAQWISLGAYVLIGIAMGIVVIRRVPTRTMTVHERQRLMAPSSSHDSPSPDLS